MIDCENIVYTRLYNAIIAEFPNASISSVYEIAVTQFPHIHIEMSHNKVYEPGMSNTNHEAYNDVTFEINIYTAQVSNRKSQAKSIFAVVDNEMISMGFKRNYSSPTPNIDTTVFRITARYTAVIGTNENGDFLVHAM